jgi:TatD DNase family protein
LPQDFHAHLDFSHFSPDLDRVVRRAVVTGVDLIVSAGTDIASSETALGIAEKHAVVAGAAGVHPHEAGKAPAGYLDALSSLLKREKSIAVGEIGLDFHYRFCDRRTQEKVFAEQLDLAGSLGLAVVLHSRGAERETLDLVKSRGIKKALFHCYTGNAETAARILDAGYFIGVTGIVTFDNPSNAELIRGLPPERLATETDAPFLSPKPLRGRRNEPANVTHIVKKLCELFPKYTEADFDTFGRSNARELFGISL